MPVKIKVKISQNFVVSSEYMNFTRKTVYRVMHKFSDPWNELFVVNYSHLSNKRGVEVKIAKSLNKEAGINVEVEKYLWNQ